MRAQNEQRISRQQIHRDFHYILSKRRDIGGVKIIRNCFFEPPNVFDVYGRRKLKAGILILSSYFLLMAAVCAAFNFR